MQLVANAAGSASITAFIAGPCSVASAGISSLASALAEHQVKIVSLASAAELGKDSAAALQSLIESLNNLSGELMIRPTHACLYFSRHQMQHCSRRLYHRTCWLTPGRLIIDELHL